MKSTLAKRVKALRDEYRLSQTEFGKHVGISYVALGNIERGITEAPQRDTIDNIIKKFGTTYDWLMEGKGEMLPDGIVDLNGADHISIASENPYKDALVQELKKQVEDWKAEYQWMKQLVNDLRNGVPMGKLKRIKETAQELKAA